MVCLRHDGGNREGDSGLRGWGGDQGRTSNTRFPHVAISARIAKTWQTRGRHEPRGQFNQRYSKGTQCGGGSGTRRRVSSQGRILSYRIAWCLGMSGSRSGLSFAVVASIVVMIDSA